MIHSISAVELQQKMKQNSLLNVIDIRETYEFEICSFANTNITMYRVQEYLVNKEKNTEIVLVCKTGKRALALANILTCESGYTHITVLEGGIMAWIENVDPTLENY